MQRALAYMTSAPGMPQGTKEAAPPVLRPLTNPTGTSGLGVQALGFRGSGSGVWGLGSGVWDRAPAGDRGTRRR
eukprot:2998083-Rhodomonas_salina.1